MLQYCLHGEAISVYDVIFTGGKWHISNKVSSG